MKQWLKKMAFGYDQQQEYVCLPKDSKDLFSLIAGEKDITCSHLFLGYKPLIVGLQEKNDRLRVSYQLNGRELGELSLEYANEFQGIQLFTGKHARHVLLSPVHQFMLQLKEKFTARPADNISMTGNLYNQLRLAYSFPREIHLISLHQQEKYNLFPTDLHGRSGEYDYFISLRIGGKACEQVEQTGKLTLCAVDISLYKAAYSLGKNHMKPMREREHFPFTPTKSNIHQNYLPNSTRSYIELVRDGSTDMGVHRIHHFKIADVQLLQPHLRQLAHVHSVYASWRDRIGLRTEYYLR